MDHIKNEEDQKVKAFGQRFSGSILDYAASALLSLFFSVGLPYLCWELLMGAIERNETGGGAFYFPSEVDEMIWAVFLGLLFLPGLVSGILFAFLTVAVVRTLGLPVTELQIPVSNGTLIVESEALAGMSVGIGIQIIFWAMLTHSVRTRLGRSQKANLSEEESEPLSR